MEEPGRLQSMGSLGVVKDTGSILGLGKNPEGGHGNPLQYSCIKHPMDKGAWQATVHRATKSHRRTRLQASTHSLSAGLLSVAVELPVLHLRVSGVISCGFVCWAAFTEQNVSTQVVAC